MENPDFELFCTEFPEVASKFKSLYESVVTQSVLEAKTQQLIYISHLAAHRYAPAIKAHIPRAMKAGANKQEILEAILMSIPAAGVINVLTILPDVVQFLEKQNK